MPGGDGTPLVEQLRAAAPTLSVGVLTADLMDLGGQLRQVQDVGARMLHFDVMDGRFCPRLTVGPPFVKAVKTPLWKDVHLLIEEPGEHLDAFVAAGADVVTVHVESSRHVRRALERLGEMANANDPRRGLVRGAALNPGTPVEAVRPLLDAVELVVLVAVNPGYGGQRFAPATADRLDALREMIRRQGRDVLIGVDGGITRANVADVAAMGADVIAAGSAVFDGKDPGGNAKAMLAAAANGARRGRAAASD
jgi:ribulose-phosphate 3-epimerase